APSPLLDEQTRRKMGEQAVALAKAVNYDSAGTVEFVAGQDKSFYFLEMNTRLQVEHPVTELITGVDLVEQMIRVAAGEKLAIAQKDVTLTGWAVESRVYAEDPFRNFLPSIGRLVKYRPPAEASHDGITVRNDTGVQEGGEISIYYDPMIAKLVTHAPSRAAAIEAQATALDAFYVDGIRHNIPFLSALMNHPRWREGRLSTGFIAEEFPKGFSARAPEGEIARRLAAVGAAIDHVLGERKRQISGQMGGRVVLRERRRAVWLERAEVALDVAREGDAITVRFIGADGLPGNPHNLVSSWVPGEPVWQGTIDGNFVAVQVRAINNGFRLAHQGFEVPVYVFTETEATSAQLMPVVSAADTGKKLLCPMPGLVVSIAVTEGQEVKAGETLAVVEAMKMQNVLRAERDGTVKKIHAAAGATLAVDALILEFA
ncbi:biotin/lipoyl-binding protein, partial [Bradyrhizobium sp. Pear76]|uniref:ATP-binding protein n=1 Tax=Bradyrhizobium oropedii TaxID=1571201 RepID=UPI001E304E22